MPHKKCPFAGIRRISVGDDEARGTRGGRASRITNDMPNGFGNGRSKPLPYREFVTKSVFPNEPPHRFGGGSMINRRGDS